MSILLPAIEYLAGKKSS